MKAVICTKQLGVHIHSPGVDKWEICQCGGTGARWEDPEAGKLIIASRDGSTDRVLGLGLNNQLLIRAVTQRISWPSYREWHEIATDASGYIFDSSKAGCWAVVFPIGTTSDVRWATPQERDECFGGS